MMKLNMFSFLDKILGFYSNTAVAWIGAVVADLVINKPLLKLSPSYVEFKRRICITSTRSDSVRW